MGNLSLTADKSIQDSAENQPLSKHEAAKQTRESIKVFEKRGVLVAMFTPDSPVPKERLLEELRGLAETAGVEVVGEIVQSRETPDPATYLGKGKIDELKTLMKVTKAEVAIFDNALSPSQGKNIESIINNVVIDRSEVILDIFATHAQTYESMLQVELAQLLYMRPRLKRMWTHLERIEGGIGSGRGPGEKQLETDRRLLDKRVAELKRKLREVEKRRERMVSGRSDHKTVSLVGYTNAGKSTLMSALTGADVYIADQLFATLDTRTRDWELPYLGTVLLSDTVGFIRNLPHHLVASFKSTLEEARHADLLMHVVDASDPEALQQVQTVEHVLSEIGATQSDPLLVLNKVDAIEDRSMISILRARFPDTVTVSARTGEGLQKLKDIVSDRLTGGILRGTLSVDHAHNDCQNWLHKHAEILETRYDENGAIYEIRIPKLYVPVLKKDPHLYLEVEEFEEPVNWRDLKNEESEDSSLPTPMFEQPEEVAHLNVDDQTNSTQQ